jgi:hypothetical protein
LGGVVHPTHCLGTSEKLPLLNQKPRVGHVALLALARWLQGRRHETQANPSENDSGDVAAPACGPAAETCGADRGDFPRGFGQGQPARPRSLVDGSTLTPGSSPTTLTSRLWSFFRKKSAISSLRKKGVHRRWRWRRRLVGWRAKPLRDRCGRENSG